MTGHEGSERVGARERTLDGIQARSIKHSDPLRDALAGALMAPDRTRGPWADGRGEPPGSLAAALAHGAAGWGWTATMGARVAASLAALHRLGHVHGDVRPATIVMDPDSDAARGPWDGRRRERQVEGSSNRSTYWAPELFSGASVSPSTDQYALGVVLVATLTGNRLPEAKGNGAGRSARLRQLLRALGATGCPPALLDVIAKMTAAEPSDRYPTMVAVAAALHEIECLALERSTPIQLEAGDLTLVPDSSTGPDAAAAEDPRAGRPVVAETPEPPVDPTTHRARRGVLVGAFFAAAMVAVTVLPDGSERSPVGTRNDRVAGASDQLVTSVIANGSLRGSGSSEPTASAGFTPLGTADSLVAGSDDQQTTTTQSTAVDSSAPAPAASPRSAAPRVFRSAPTTAATGSTGPTSTSSMPSTTVLAEVDSSPKTTTTTEAATTTSSPSTTEATTTTTTAATTSTSEPVASTTTTAMTTPPSDPESEHDPDNPVPEPPLIDAS